MKNIIKYIAAIAFIIGVYTVGKIRMPGNDSAKKESENMPDKNKTSEKNGQQETSEKENFMQTEEMEARAEQIKTVSAEKIQERHREAERIIKESAANIFQETGPGTIEKTTDAWEADAMLDELENM